MGRTENKKVALPTKKSQIVGKPPATSCSPKIQWERKERESAAQKNSQRLQLLTTWGRIQHLLEANTF